MPTDQTSYAGNQGDVVKHPLLLAALSASLAAHPDARCCYADIFAGYAEYTLPRDGAWRHGIGTAPKRSIRRERSEHAAFWWESYAKAVAEGAIYPGSVRIALAAASLAGREIEISAWDISAAAVESLRRTLRPTDNVFSRAATPTDAAVVGADFLFIDPWSLSEWPRVKAFLGLPVPSVIGWLPVSANNTGRESDRSRQARDEARESGCHALVVTWRPRVRHSRELRGCQLVYRLRDGEAEEALLAAAREVARAFRWELRELQPRAAP